jgi:hypothetical protein
VSFIVEEDEAFDLGEISFLGTNAIMLKPDVVANAVEQRWFQGS